MKCSYCNEEEPFPFRCPYCGEFFCIDHRLPEAHECRNLALALPPSKKFQPRASEKTYETPASLRVDIMAKGTNMREVINFLIGAGLVWGVGASMLRFQLFSLFFYVNSIIFLMAFILHEFAHKMAAKKNGLIGEFQLSPWGAVLTLFSIFLPLKVIAPGAVMIYGYADMKRMGRIAMWGPLTNIIMASIMLPFLLTFGRIIAVAYYLNAFIALFNLLPIGILDGKKIISWNRIIWAALFVQALIHIIIGYISL